MNSVVRAAIRTILLTLLMVDRAEGERQHVELPQRQDHRLWAVESGAGLSDEADRFWSSEFGGSRQLSDFVYSLYTFQGELIAGGQFAYAGDQLVSHIAAWNDSTWRPLGGGFSSCPELGLCIPKVSALTTWNGRLIAGGWFHRLDSHLGQIVNNIAAWNGSYWSPLGDGFDEYVHELIVHDGLLIAGGSFTKSGSRTVERIARWTGASWQPIGDGFNSHVTSLAVYQGDLIAGGSFWASGGVPIGRVARWTGSAWVPLGLGSESSVNALLVSNDTLYAAGAFRGVGGSAEDVVRWDGESWIAVGQDLSCCLNALATFEGRLVVGGVQGRLLRWNGSAWLPLGSGVNGTVTTFAERSGSLYVGGYFTTAGEKPSLYVARWDDTPTSLEVWDFAVVAEGEGALIRWVLGAEAVATTRAVRVQRAMPANEAFEDLIVLAPENREMSYFDATPALERATGYRLALERVDGSQLVTQPIEFVRTPGSRRSEIVSAVLSPTDRTVEVTYRVGRGDDIAKLSFFDVRGRVLRTLLPESRGAGMHRVTWDRLETTGSRTARGVYFVRLDAGPWVSTRSVVVHR